jgi:hypothetical protein
MDCLQVCRCIKFSPGATTSEESIVTGNYPAAQSQTGQPAKALFCYFAANLIVWYFLRAVEVGNPFTRIAVPLMITLAVILPLHLWWIRSRER